MRRSIVRPRRRSDNILEMLFILGLLLLFLMAAGIAGVVVFDQVRRFTATSDVLPQITVNRDPVDEEPPVRIDPQQVYTGTERVNILVMGVDQRAGEDGPCRTDSMMVLTIDPVTLRAGVLSIPRDLWVPIWGYNMQARINTANFIGDRDGYPGGGPALAAATVEYNFGIRIHHYVRLNFTAFVELVDRIGGIEICVKEEIKDPYYPDEAYGYDPLYIPAGCHHFDGALALKYARVRHTAGGDFDRARRQQQVMQAIFERVTRLDLLPQLVLQAPELWVMLQDSVVTDPELTLDKIVALANLASKVPPENVRYGVIDENYVDLYTTPDNQKVLIPVREEIRKLRDYIFADAPAPVSDDPVARLAEEAAKIQVLNGTTVEGLAGRTAEFLRQQGFQVAHTGNAPASDYAESLIIVYTGKTYTAESLCRVLNLPPTAIVHGADPTVEYDILVILGADYRPPVQ